MLRSLAFAAALLALVPVAQADRVATASEVHDDASAALPLLDRVVACGDAAVTLPADWEKPVAAHCAKLGKMLERARSGYIAKAQRFLAALEPGGLPSHVVYPFGGGDLLSALVAYQSADEVTTISLEHAGDPTRLAGLSGKELGRELGRFRAAAAGLLLQHDSKSDNLIDLERGPVPGQISFALTALTALGYTPIALRFFRVEDDGTLHYYGKDEIAALAGTKSTKQNQAWVDTDQSIVFANAELSFRRPDGSIVVHRHIAANLDDAHLAGSALLRHLEAKGDVVAITKAASYCLWNPRFSAIRDYLTAHLVFMVSDSTGIPPRFARKAGLRQTTYGTYTGPFLEVTSKHDAAFQALWSGQKKRKLPFRFGYLDKAGNVHMLVTERKPK